MESKFIPTLQVGNGYTYLKLRGVLDEDNLLVNLLSQIQGRLLLIDMAELDRINSCGVRDWVNWLNQIQALGLQVILLRCSPAVVAQANMVTNFAADSFIHSFYAPYVHPDTGEEQRVLLFTEDLRQTRPIRAPKIFAEDGVELEFDEFEESYFTFVNDPRIMNFQVADDIQAVIQYFLPESAAHQPVLSHKDTAMPDPMRNVAPMAGPSSMPMAGPSSINNVYGMPHSSYSNLSGIGSVVNPNSAYSARTSPSGIYGVLGGGRPSGPNFGPASVSGLSPVSAPANYGSNVSGSMTGPSSIGAPATLGAPNPMAAANPGVPQSPMGAPASMLPTPAAPQRHEQPPLPGNLGYQQLPQTTGHTTVPENVVPNEVKPVAAPAPAPVAAPAAPKMENPYNAAPAPAPTPVSAPAPVASPSDNYAPYNPNNDGALSSQDKKIIISLAVIALVLIIVVLIVYICVQD